jgi:hypothetical protein
MYQMRVIYGESDSRWTKLKYYECTLKINHEAFFLVLSI